MKKLTLKLKNVVDAHFGGYTVIIEPDHDDELMYKLRVNRRMDVTAIGIFPKAINRVIKQNFTIFERLIYGKKIQNAAIMVLMSTIYNLINSKSCIEPLVDFSKGKISTELAYERKKGEFEVILSKMVDHIIPYKDRNKYLIQPNITVNLGSKLPIIFSNIELVGFMNLIGYRPEKNKRGKVLPWQHK
jgi:hypothetical protein